MDNTSKWGHIWRVNKHRKQPRKRRWRKWAASSPQENQCLNPHMWELESRGKTRNQSNSRPHNTFRSIRYHTDWMSQPKYARSGEALIPWGNIKRWCTCIWVCIWMRDQILMPRAPLSLIGIAICGLLSFGERGGGKGKESTFQQLHGERDTLEFLPWFFMHFNCLDFMHLLIFGCAVSSCGAQLLLVVASLVMQY